MAKAMGSNRVGANVQRVVRLVGVLSALTFGACGSAEPGAPRRAVVVAPASTDAIQSVSTEPAAPHDPDGVPDFGPATACATATGDARAMRTRLRALERGREPAPPEAASLLEGCGATAHDVAQSLEKAGRAIARGRAHDYAAAAAYYRRALEVDPSYAAARLSLAGARAKLGQVDGAMYQLDQIRESGAAGRRYVARAHSDGTLAPLRLLPRFWAWAGNPVPEMAATLPASTDVALTSLGSALSFTPAPEIEPEVIFARLPIEGAHYRTIPPAVNAAAGLHITRARSVARDKMLAPWLEHLDSIGATLLTRPSAFRFGEGQVVVAIPIMYGEADAEEFAVVIAQGPESGPYDIVRVVASSAECATPAAFTSRDHRVLGFFTSCDEGDDPTRFGRCIVFAENGTVVSRCGNGASVAAVAGQGDGSGDGDYGEEDYGNEMMEEEWEGSGD